MASMRAVIFDVDGTLVDSEPAHVQAWDEALSTYGESLETLPREIRETMAGRKPLQIAEDMVQALHLRIEPQKLLMDKTRIFFAQAPHAISLMEGAGACIEELHRAGFRLAIGTSLDRTSLDIILSRFDIAHFFEVIVTGDQISRGKPDPETYLQVCSALDLPPSQCVVIEDAPSGIASAKDAGCLCIALESANTVAQHTERADLRVTSLRAVTPQFLRTLASSTS